jgi:hypothetical protein
VAEPLQLIVIASPSRASESALRFAGRTMMSPVFAVEDEGGEEGGGTIGINMIERVEFTTYVNRLDAHDPVTVSVPRVTQASVAGAHELAAALERDIVLLGRSSLIS